MAVVKTMRIYRAPFERLSEIMISRWSNIPSSVASDAMNRCQSMNARVKPLAAGMRICGQARTVVPMPGDNSMVLHAASIATAGDVVVVDGGGLEDVAMAGEWVVRACRRRGLNGLVVGGSVRDVAVLRDLGFPVFATGAVPRGPHKNFGGRMDVPAAVGGAPVQPGDLILGDDDGVVVVPLDAAERTLAVAETLMAREEEFARQLERGDTLVDLVKLERCVVYDRYGREIEVPVDEDPA